MLRADSRWFCNTSYSICLYLVLVFCHQILLWEVTYRDLLRSNKDSVLRRAAEVPCPLDPVPSSAQLNSTNAIVRTQTHSPSPLPTGSSSSIPIQAPPFPIPAEPANRTVPLLCRPPSPAATSHLAPGTISDGMDDGGGGACVRLVGVGANRPILLAFRCAKTVSEGRAVSTSKTGVIE